jgi:hypothetical protein
MVNINNVLYVTSFAKDMYDASGRRLLDSFIKYNPQATLLVCSENIQLDINIQYPNIIVYPLETSKFLQEWLIENNDVIPDYLGGKATKLSDPKLFESEWNRKASRWFRKIASLEYALTRYQDQYKYILWIDADCYFTQGLKSTTIQSIFGNSGAIYHLGKRRIESKTGIESGVIGFQSIGGGFILLQRVIDCYTSKQYLKYPRWDDGYVFRQILIEDNLKPLKHKATDLVTKNKSTGKVIANGPFASYIKHEKGKHASQGILI